MTLSMQLSFLHVFILEAPSFLKDLGNPNSLLELTSFFKCLKSVGN
jgi:hypothetical protein